MFVFQKYLDLRNCIDFACKKHNGRLRYDGFTPEILHLIDVANILLYVGGVRELFVLEAGILHDVLEDTSCTLDELQKTFGAKVSFIVNEVSDEQGIFGYERKKVQIQKSLFLSKNAKLIKIADKISNILDTNALRPLGWDLNKKLRYINFCKSVVNNCKGTNDKLEKFFWKVYFKRLKEFESV